MIDRGRQSDELGATVSDTGVLAARRSPITAAFKVAAPAVAVAFGLSAASMADAATYVMTNVSMENARNLRLSGAGFSTKTVKATPVQFDGYLEQGAVDQPFTDLVAFCVDVYHAIQLKAYNPGLYYTDETPLTHNSHPTNPSDLTVAQLNQIGSLVHYGTNVFYSGLTGATRYNELAAVQGAIWHVVSGLTVTSVNNNGQTAAIQNRLNLLQGAGYESAFLLPASTSKNVTLLSPFSAPGARHPWQYPSFKGSQAFAIAAIPEPATWVMMIGGFAFAGAALRRARQTTVAAAA